MRPDGFYAATWNYGEKLEQCQFVGDKDGGFWIRDGKENERREPIAIIGPLDHDGSALRKSQSS